ncbi:hypothetical protein [Streptomyces sp. NPDC046332]|uniref:hypothetical protein n=1 Tax=unclassified Streptomyces TaxID=2593676 RepID=UPI0033E1BDBE
MAAHTPIWAAAGLLAAAIFVHSLGEIRESSAGLALDCGLAPRPAQGQHQGLLGLGFSAGQTLAPAREVAELAAVAPALSEQVLVLSSTSHALAPA